MKNNVERMEEEDYPTLKIVALNYYTIFFENYKLTEMQGVKIIIFYYFLLMYQLFSNEVDSFLILVT